MIMLERRLMLARAPTPTMTALKVAFASADLRHVDQHFGAAAGLIVYAVTPEHCALLEVVRFAPRAHDGNEDKLGEKIAVLRDCIAVYCQEIGAAAIARLRAVHVQPIKVAPGTPIKRLLAELRQEWRDGPRPWLARAIARQAEAATDDRFAAMEAAGWNES